MSKSDPSGCLFVLDEPEQIRKKIMKAKTDSLTGIIQIESRPEISNLVRISALTEGTSVEHVVDKYRSSSHAEFKDELANSIIRKFRPVRDIYKTLDNCEIAKLLNESGELAKQETEKTLNTLESILFK